MEDSRFLELTPVYIDKNPELLQWFLDQDEYLVDEMIAVQWREIELFRSLSIEAYELFSRATEQILKHDRLKELEIPSAYHKLSLIHI